MAQVLDLKVFRPEKRIFRLHDGDNVREIDVSRVPNDAVIAILGNMDTLAGMQSGKVDKEAMDTLIDIAVQTCRANDQEVTREWLMEQLDVFDIVKLIYFVIDPVIARLTEGGGSKKKKPET